jgi:xanthine dehydrogenase YagR molybdenum-binding subunit
VACAEPGRGCRGQLDTAKSPLIGGQIWGISAALHEATEIDRERARYYNTDLAEYLVPVNANVGEIQTIMLAEGDELVNELGSSVWVSSARSA